MKLRDYNNLEDEVLHQLRSKLPAQLYYHGLDHTLEVLEVCNQYIRLKAVDTSDAELLRVGALLHDIGFTITNKNHEEESVSLAGPLMEKYGYSKSDQEIVKGLIRSTRIPQMPKNELEKIICDSDLDYLGREDFYAISNRLFEELKAFGLVSNKAQWNQRQIRFMEDHRYHTDFARANRQPSKQQRILELRKSLPGTE